MSSEKIAYADRKEAGQHAAEMRKEEHRAQQLENGGSNLTERISEDLSRKVAHGESGNVSSSQLPDSANGRETKERQLPNYYLREIGKQNLWLVTEFLSSMRLNQFLALPYESELRICQLILESLTSEKVSEDGFPKTFGDNFPDVAIRSFRDANGNPLRGGRRIAYWRLKSATGHLPEAVLKRQKTFLLEHTLVSCRTKLRDMLFGWRMREEESRSPAVAQKVADLRLYWAERCPHES